MSIEQGEISTDKLMIKEVWWYGAPRFLSWSSVVGEGDGILMLGQDGMGSLILNKRKHGVGAPDEDLHILTQAPIMYG